MRKCRTQGGNEIIVLSLKPFATSLGVTCLALNIFFPFNALEPQLRQKCTRSLEGCFSSVTFRIQTRQVVVMHSSVKLTGGRLDRVQYPVVGVRLTKLPLQIVCKNTNRRCIVCLPLTTTCNRLAHITHMVLPLCRHLHSHTTTPFTATSHRFDFIISSQATRSLLHSKTKEATINCLPRRSSVPG